MDAAEATHFDGLLTGNQKWWGKNDGIGIHDSVQRK
jgi:hypothetical protein